MLLCLFILRLAYGDSVAALDSPVWADRAQAQARLARNWPLTAEACAYARSTTESAEVVARTDAVLSWARVVDHIPDACWDEVLWGLVVVPDRNPIPWAPQWTIEIFNGCPQADRAMLRLLARGRKEGWVKKNTLYASEIAHHRANHPGQLWELGELRFAYRGLPVAGEWYLMMKQLGATESGVWAPLAWYWQYRRLFP